MTNPNQILTESFLATLRNKYTLSDGTTLKVATNWTNVGTDDQYYILLQSITTLDGMTKCMNDFSGSIQALVVGRYDGNVDKGELYNIQTWLLSQSFFNDKAQLLSMRKTATEQTTMSGSDTFVQIINTFNFTIRIKD